MDSGDGGGDGSGGGGDGGDGVRVGEVKCVMERRRGETVS
jgi:hypothetical protein